MSTYILAIRPDGYGRDREDGTLERRRAMEQFLSAVERRAYRIAVLAVRDRDDALDIVQDTMIRLARSYAERTEAEWTPLFYRILQNRIRDHQRHQAVRRRVLAWFTWRDDDDEDVDPVALAPDHNAVQPDHQHELDGAMTALESAVQELPTRQQQAFLLRTVECLDVAATAKVMGCSDGTVKTHYSRAVHSLRATVGDYWPGHDHDD